MTKKDYVLIAKAIKEAKQALSYASVNMAETNRSIGMVCDYLDLSFKRSSPRFDSVAR